MGMNSAVNLVSVECHDDGGMCSGRGERGIIEFLVAFVDCLVQRNAGERDQLRIDRGVNEDNTAGASIEE